MPSAATGTATPVAAIVPAAAEAATAGVLVVLMKAAPPAPPDAPAHLAYTPGGGSGGEPACVDIDDAPAASAASAASAAPAEEVPLPRGTMFWCYAGLNEPDGAEVVAQLEAPNGLVQAITRTVQSNTAQFERDFQADDPAGVYTFTAELSGRAIVERFIPGIGVIPFNGWQPGEPVRVLVYELEADRHTLRHDGRAQADAGGRLRVQPVGEDGRRIPSSIVVAVGKQTGCQAYHWQGRAQAGAAGACGIADPDRIVPGGVALFVWSYDAPHPAHAYRCAQFDGESQLDVGARAVVGQGLSRIRVRAEAGKGADIAGHIVPGEEVAVLDGPICADGAFWWRIRSQASGLEGWSMEGEAGEVWLVRSAP
jgi:hypothetical protein